MPRVDSFKSLGAQTTLCIVPNTEPGARQFQDIINNKQSIINSNSTAVERDGHDTLQAGTIDERGGLE